MSYGLKYRGAFFDYYERKFLIELYQKDYNGSVYDIRVKDVFIETKKEENIYTRLLTIEVYTNSFPYMEEVLSCYDNEIKVILKTYDTNQILFRGYISPDANERKLLKYDILRFSFNDYLYNLKSIRLELETDYYSLQEYFYYIFNKIYLDDNETKENIYINSTLRINQTNETSLMFFKKCYIHSDAFLDDKGRYEYCYEVLQRILKTFDLYVYIWNDIIFIDRLTDVLFTGNWIKWDWNSETYIDNQRKRYVKQSSDIKYTNEDVNITYSKALNTYELEMNYISRKNLLFVKTAPYETNLHFIENASIIPYANKYRHWNLSYFDVWWWSKINNYYRKFVVTIGEQYKDFRKISIIKDYSNLLCLFFVFRRNPFEYIFTKQLGEDDIYAGNGENQYFVNRAGAWTLIPSLVVDLSKDDTEIEISGRWIAEAETTPDDSWEFYLPVQIGIRLENDTELPSNCKFRSIYYDETDEQWKYWFSTGENFYWSKTLIRKEWRYFYEEDPTNITGKRIIPVKFDVRIPVVKIIRDWLNVSEGRAKFNLFLSFHLGAFKAGPNWYDWHICTHTEIADLMVKLDSTAYPDVYSFNIDMRFSGEESEKLEIVQGGLNIVNALYYGEILKGEEYYYDIDPITDPLFIDEGTSEGMNLVDMKAKTTYKLRGRTTKKLNFSTRNDKFFRLFDIFEDNNLKRNNYNVINVIDQIRQNFVECRYEISCFEFLNEEIKIE